MKQIKLLLAAIAMLCVAPTEGVWGVNQSQVRCEAVTRQGTRCKNKALERSKYCRVHQAKDPKVAQCKAKTKSGAKCSRAAKISGYCQQHYNMYREGKLK